MFFVIAVEADERSVLFKSCGELMLNRATSESIPAFEPPALQPHLFEQVLIAGLNIGASTVEVYKIQS